MSKESEQIADAVVNALEKTRTLDAETHRKHHEYIDTCIASQEESRLLWAGVRRQVFGWGIVVILTGIGIAVADATKHFFTK